MVNIRKKRSDGNIQENFCISTGVDETELDTIVTIMDMAHGKNNNLNFKLDKSFNSYIGLFYINILI